MNDSSNSDPPGRRDERRQQRIEAIQRWVEYVREHPPEVWGEQQNTLVNAQLEAARESGLDVDHRRRVDRAGRDRKSPGK